MSFAVFPKICTNTSLITIVCKIRRAVTMGTLSSSFQDGHIPATRCTSYSCRPMDSSYVHCQGEFVRQTYWNNNNDFRVPCWMPKRQCFRNDNLSEIFYSHQRKYSVKHSTSTDDHSLNKTKMNAGDGLASKPLSFKKSIEQIITTLQNDMILTVPNVLTLMRMIMSPVIGYFVLQEFYHMACIVFVIAGVSDVLDGYIARTFPSQTSELGSFIDPLADKFLVSILFVTLTAVNLIPVALTALVIFRDVCLTVAGLYVRYISLNPRPTTLRQFFDLTNRSAALQPTAISKANTAIQLLLVAFTLGAPVFGYVDHPALQALWYVTASTTLISGIGYIFAKDTFKLIQQNRKK